MKYLLSILLLISISSFAQVSPPVSKEQKLAIDNFEPNKKRQQDKDACERVARGTPVTNPVDVVKIQNASFNKCMLGKGYTTPVSR